jgi:hypothetical protein
MRGANVRCTLFIDSRPADNMEFATSCEIKEDAELHKDSYLGRKRSKADKTLNGYDVTLEFDIASVDMIRALAERERAREENRQIAPLALKLELTQRDGTEKSLLFTGVEAKLDLSYKGRTDPFTGSMELFAEEMELV